VWFSQAATLQFYWSNEDGGFGSARVAQQVVPAQQWTTVRFNLAANPQWAGKTVQAFRIDPGTTPGMSFAIDYMAVLDRNEDRTSTLVPRTFDFNADAQAWGSPSAHVSGLRWEDGKLKGSSIGIDPNVTSPVFSHTGLGGVAVQIKSSINTRFAIFWATTEGGFSQTRCASLPVTNVGWQTLYFDLRSIATWAGKTVTRLRLDPADLTGQDFEIDSVMLLTPSAFQDGDADGLSNFAETLHLTDPASRSTLRGRLPLETWAPLTHYSTRSLVADSGFYGAPTSTTTLFDSTTGQQPGTYYATRARGYLLAPTTGNYRFWISGRNGVELYLSTDHTKYRKRRIAEINPELGNAHGIPFGDTNLWDQTSAQMSEPIPLVKGQLYYFETLQAVGHGGNAQMSLAWAPPGEGRLRIPGASLRSYTTELADADDDDLPDSWESQYGLDVLDNGRIDLAKQGERGDFDSDGLSNREEYLLNTNPADADTDGDGSSDYDEVRQYATSPTLSNSIINTLVDSPLLTNYDAANTSGSWQTFDGGLLGSSFRGRIQWTFTVPADGWWVVDLAGRLRGTLRSIEDLPLGIMVDSKSLAEQNLRFVNGQAASLKVLTPFLQAGTHTFSVDIRNDIGRRTFQIQSLQVFGLGGFDGNGNGRPDWVDNVLSQANQLLPVATESAVSPLFIEGSIRHLGGATVAGSSTNVTVQRGLGDLHWFANVPLATEGSTSVSVSLENQSQSLGVAWTRWNAMTGQNLTIRVGDSVKIAGWLTTTTNGTVQISIAGQTETLSENGYIVKTFNAPGTFPVTVTHSSGSQTTSSITVMAADFGTPVSFFEDTVTWRSFPNVPASLKISAETSLAVNATLVDGTGQKAQLRPFRSGDHVLAARIPNGSIVALGKVTTMGISDALRNDATLYVGSTADGYRVIRTPLVITNLPVGGRAVLTIFRAGVTFLDGLTVKTLTADDFIDGVAYVDFRFPPDQTGGYCHYIDIYDAAGNSLGRH
jgi:hypothetical protein